MPTHALKKWLEQLGIVHTGEIFFNADTAQLVTQAILNGEGQLTSAGALAAITAPYTGRSPNDKYVVDNKDVADLWWGDVNRPVTKANFEKIKDRVTAYLSNRALYIVDAFVGADPDYRLGIRVVTEFAWQALATKNQFIYTGEPHSENPEITVLVAPNLLLNPEIDSVRSNAGILLDIKEKTILIAASKYFG
ncbi:MAG: phosphoenolpyruvate carboxykinase (ATP), partial [Chloroflexota bacterium]|nr:phosphoenolpyruvate carboxykinase (ATP) [Chloroflexota bacterium]